MFQNIDLTDPLFHDSNVVRAWLETSRWLDGSYCPHCGTINVMRMDGGAHRCRPVIPPPRTQTEGCERH
jgi:transposase-like zinc ribbon protein